VRNLAAALVALGHDVVPVRWCETTEAVVRADRKWTSGLAEGGGPHLPLIEEGVALHLSDTDRDQLDGGWLLVPEVPHVAGDDFPSLAVALDYARFNRLRTAAVFYDLIPLRRSGYESMSSAHAAYARALGGADLLLAISEYTARDLDDWWAAEDPDRARRPRVETVLLPEEIIGTPRVISPKAPTGKTVRFVAVGTVEPRKNQLGAMRAFCSLVERRPDLDLRFDVVGGVHPAVADEARALVASHPGLRLHGYQPDDQVLALVRAAHATVFVSLDEGYGLPIAESLWLGRPCLCSDHGSMAEIAAGGGCLTVTAADPLAIERGFEQLADDAALRRELTLQATTRPLRSWQDYAASIVGGLLRHPVVERLVVLEGAHDCDVQAEALSAAGVDVDRLHWNGASDALLPGSRRAPSAPLPGAGQLHGRWAVIPAGTAAGPGEARAILDCARGLGLQVALEAEVGWPSDLLTSADLTLFPDEHSCDEALARALQQVDRTVGVRGRFRTGHGTHSLAAIGRDRPLLAAAGLPSRPARVFYWVGLTVTQPFNTGVQRVTRLLAAALERLGVEVVPVAWDPAKAAMVRVPEAEAEHLARWSGPAARPWTPLPDDLSGEWLLVPEITVPVVPPGSSTARLGHALGMRVAAIFYDLIPAKMPENYPVEAVEALSAYWRGLAEVDLALPISWTMAADLARWLTTERLTPPRIVPAPLAGEAPGEPRTQTGPASLAGGRPLELLAVGTWEPRKNYPLLLRALRTAQQRTSRPLHLTIVGRRAGFAELDQQIEELAAQANVTLLGHVTDARLRELHEKCSATVFASWEEGFGLPVLESLWQGRPCLAHEGSALAEVAPGGGVLAVDVRVEAAVEDALVRLADEPGLLESLAQEAIARPIRSWDEYAEDVIRALSRTGGAPGWPLPALVRRRPLLTCAITTYNRAPWLAHSLPRLLEATRQWRDVVEIVVCDNASTDDTPSVIARFEGERGLRRHRNAQNVGMLGNLGATARVSSGAFIWELGDDDLLVDGAIENVLEGLARHPDVEMAYMNYSYTSFDDPARLADVEQVVAEATPIAPGGENRWVRELREVSGLNENLFTAIYACAFRRDHALRAYHLDTRGAPFSSLETCVPSSVYALHALQDRPAWWVGEPALVVNMNVSWLRWALLWHLERMPDLFELAERKGVDPESLDVYRMQHLAEAERWVRAVYFEAEDDIRTRFSMRRLLERTKHLPEFRRRHLAGVRRAYEQAHAAGRVALDPAPPADLFAAYGL
jgi:glycosyltransferase involved in cell wall biosynthesis